MKPTSSFSRLRFEFLVGCVRCYPMKGKIMSSMEVALKEANEVSIVNPFKNQSIVDGMLVRKLSLKISQKAEAISILQISLFGVTFLSPLIWAANLGAGIGVTCLRVAGVVVSNMLYNGPQKADEALKAVCSGERGKR